MVLENAGAAGIITSNWSAGFGVDKIFTGRVVNLAGQGFLRASEYLTRWLSAAPSYIRDSIKTSYPGLPGGGGSDFASFVAAGAGIFPELVELVLRNVYLAYQPGYLR
ncbi:MAG TPA: hypothetical protein VHC96_21390 [Puia sp.]|nr:hypothetical protein [Puia sp.]